MPLLKGVSKRLPSVIFAFIISLIAAFIAMPAAFSQGNPVKFTSAAQVRNVGGFPVGTSGAYEAVAGYFNTDKRLDIVFSVANFNFESPLFFTNIALNQGSGKFSVHDSPEFGTDGPGPVLAADFNRDGISDVISCCDSFSPGLVIAFGRGDGTFTDPTFIQVDAANSNVTDAVAADFDGNGSTDLAVLTDINTLVILLNDGKGNFHSAFTYKVPAPSNGVQGRIAAGDINGDTLPDIVLLNGGNGRSGGTITPYLSTHGGALMKGTTYSVPNAIGFHPAIADINKDGHGDVAVPTSNGIKFLLGSSGGQLTPGASITVPGAREIVFADFNKDGKIDLAVAGTQPFSGLPSFVNVYFGRGNGTFNYPSVYSAGNGPVSLLVGDFYGAGNADLVAFAFGDASLYLLRNPGNGYFQAAPTSYVNHATGIVAGDFNRDGKKDVAVVNTPDCKAPRNGSVTVLPGTGLSFLLPGKTYPIGMHGAAIAAGDLNGDGILDLVVVNATPGDTADTSVLLGKPDGTFQPARNFKLGSLSHDVVLADMNHDGKLDLITDGGVALGKGDGTFAARKPFPGGFNFSTGIHFAVGDVNGDGKLDVVAVTAGSCGIGSLMQTLFGDGKGGFSLGNLVNDSDLGDVPITSIALGRLRPGGPLDVVYSVFGFCSENIQSGAEGLVGDGHGGFSNHFEAGGGNGFGDPFEPGPIILGDFNGDGKLDVGIGAQGFFAVSRGNGNDTFQPQQVFAADFNNSRDFETGAPKTTPGGIAVADFNNDGHPDVVLTSGLGVTRLYNQTPPPK